jgi:sugar phosphate isomerase/epimerase
MVELIWAIEIRITIQTLLQNRFPVYIRGEILDISGTKPVYRLLITIKQNKGNQMAYPKIFLAIDNCFAYKRWTRPEEWCDVIAGLGVRYVEASADNELDPLYMGSEYLEDWIEAVRRAQDASGVRVANLYSGHGTYTTLGLTHTDPRVRRRMIDHWFKPMAAMSGHLGAGFGFFAHAFAHHVLQDAGLYKKTIAILEQELVEINQYAASCGCGDLGIEQMYSPHHYPWTIAQTGDLIRTVSEKSGRPFYFTEDVGHHHNKFQRPDESRLTRTGGRVPRQTWLGSDHAFALGEAGEQSLPALAAEIRNTPHLFAEAKDSDCYAWLSALGCYSPIIHLQQTDGQTSAHLPFTAERNAWGKIDGKRILRALLAGYDRPEEKGMPKRCEKIYMTLELFAPTAVIIHGFLQDLRESVSYWRQWIPRDGMYLDELVSRLE